MMRGIGKLHVLTDTGSQDRHDHPALARLAIAGGADTIQLRDKRATTRELVEIAREVGKICRRAGVPLVINDRVDVSQAADADGVHLGQDDFPISLAREILGPDRIIGGSATSVAQATEAMWAGADYVGIGSIYATSSKPDAGSPVGVAHLREVASAIEIPVIAIGGVTAERVAELLEAGAQGVAVIRAVVGAPDPQAAVAELQRAIATALGSKAQGG
jgi:thiamine-phosphate pyrophosphorylase